MPIEIHVQGIDIHDENKIRNNTIYVKKKLELAMAYG